MVCGGMVANLLVRGGMVANTCMSAIVVRVFVVMSSPCG